MIRKLSEIIRKDKSKPKQRIVVAAAEDEAVLRSLQPGIKEGIIIPILVGDKTEIAKIAQFIDFDLTGVQIVHNDRGASVSADLAVSIVSFGDADILMKGLVSTGALLKA